ncbi:LPS assembly protein LptD [Luteimonas sp BLCC-B24]|uniref:LPS assembly protein LptD n=1 Tax=Luteimonas sp. BLCC-B24 TaxID=3025317 RepID=UPI00234DE06A|nr:LPS assembly protein LptD [Luteimonas sp. BLCC-B24]MDC7807670.1 LPS assembly protein LptD [Luteimonas sp. BLCC-B24]
MRPALRLLPLPFCIAVSLSAHADEALRPNYWALCPIEDAVPAFADAQAPVGSVEDRENQPTNIDGNQFEGLAGIDSDFTGNVTGDVTLRRGDQFLGTDDLQFSQEDGTFVADGNVRYQDSGLRVIADRVEGDTLAESYRMDNVRYQLTARRGNGGADRIRMDGSVGALLGSTYSTCTPSDRWWELKAGQIDIDTDMGMGTARNATLRVGKVPVLYVPWFRFPIDERRLSGLLFPRISQSGRNGFDYTQPIYLNLAPQFDMTLEPRFMSRRGVQLGTEFRFQTERTRGELDVAYLPSDKLARRERELEEEQVPIVENRRKDDRAFLSFGGSWDINPTWQGRTNLTWMSDPRYLEDSSNNVDGISSVNALSQLGVFGQGTSGDLGYWNASVLADYQLLTDYTLPEAVLPYNRLPHASFTWQRPYGRWINAGVDATATRFSHLDDAARPGGSRVDLKPYVSMPFEGAAWFVRPTVAYRQTNYSLDRVLADRIAEQRARAELGIPGGVPVPADTLALYRNTSPSRGQPIGSIDAGLFFDRNTRWRGEDYLHTLEPRLFYLNSPYRDQSALPLFDTTPLTFGWGQLFRDNRYSGADRQADANQVTMAVSTRLIRESDGLEKLSASLGQIVYLSDSRVTIPGEAQVEQGRSAWVSDATYAINDRWTVSAGYQWDPKFRREDLMSLRSRYLIGDEGIVNFAYRRRADLIEQADLSFLYPVSPAWSLVGRYYYSFTDHRLLEAVAGVQWDSCCLAARVVGRRYVRNRQGELNNAIMFELELKGLGSAGPDTEDRLRRAILGYYRDDLYLVPPSELRNSDDVETLTPGLSQ